jgi:hypothetical protein
MCWYSAEHAKILQAEAGQRVVMRKMHGSTNWMVRECDAGARSPSAVCLLDGTNVLLRPSEDEQVSLNVPPDTNAVFRMLTRPKRDVLVLSDGRELAIDGLPAGLLIDVLVVPGSEKLSKVLEAEPVQPTNLQAAIPTETEAEPEPVFNRLRRFLLTPSLWFAAQPASPPQRHSGSTTQDVTETETPAHTR